jgi:hypothetical protein
MAVQAMMTLGQLKALVTAHLSHTRPTGDAELLEAINYGYGKVLRAVRAVRPQPSLSFFDNFTLQSGVTEYDVGRYSPPLVRPVRLVMGGPNRGRTIRFRQGSIQSDEFVSAELSGAGSFSTLLYDLVEGLLPKSRLPLQNQTATTVVVAIPWAEIPAASLPVAGDLIVITDAGTPNSAGGATTPADHYAVVTLASFGPVVLTVTFAPATPVVLGPGNPSQLIPMRRKVMIIAPALQHTATGRLWYQYAPDYLEVDSDLVDNVVAQHRDCVVYFALSALRLSIGDADTDRYLARAEALRSEMIQDLEPSGWQNTEAIGSDLDGVGDY